MWKLEVLAILWRARVKFPLFKRGGCEKFYPVLRGGGRKEFRTRDFPILKPPLPVINDQSLTAWSVITRRMGNFPDRFVIILIISDQGD